MSDKKKKCGQRTLFGGGVIEPVSRRKRVSGGMTKAQQYQMAREARYWLLGELQQVCKDLCNANSRDSYLPIIEQLTSLNSTSQMKILQRRRERGDTDFLEPIGYIETLLTQARRAHASFDEVEWERWWKFKPHYHDNILFICCLKRAGGTSWVYISNRGRIFCRKCLTALKGSKIVRKAPFVRHNLVKGMSKEAVEREVRQYSERITSTFSELSERLARLKKFGDDLREYSQKEWGVEQIVAKKCGSIEELIEIQQRGAGVK
jgi:hypothetical protein